MSLVAAVVLALLTLTFWRQVVAVLLIGATVLMVIGAVEVARMLSTAPPLT